MFGLCTLAVLLLYALGWAVGAAARGIVEDFGMDRDAVLSLWEVHKEERWPQVGSQLEGPLMTLDTVISGCVVYFLDSPEGLDAQRIGIIEDCITDLDSLTDELEEGCQPYFQRLRHLGALLITTHHAI